MKWTAALHDASFSGVAKRVAALSGTLSPRAVKWAAALSGALFPRVIRWTATLVGACLISACASGQKSPDWQIEAKGAMERAVAAYLEGNSRVEAAELARARSQLSRTGRVDLLATAELLHCASRVASLVFEPCAGFEALRPDALAPQQAYADYLRGQLDPADVALLPEAQRGVAAGDATALKSVADPLSQLVAAGVLLQAGKASPVVIEQAIDAASSQGWRRPLLAWLGVQLKRAEQGGDMAQAERLRRRIGIVQQAGALPLKQTPTDIGKDKQ